MISCTEAVQRLWDHLEREDLPPEQAALLDEHLALCRRCCGEAEFAHQLRLLLIQNANDELPFDARRRMEAFLTELEGIP